MVALVKVCWGVVEAVEIHPDDDSAWSSLKKYVGAPPEASLHDWWRAWRDGQEVEWYDHDNYGDCRLLYPSERKTQDKTVVRFSRRTRK